MKAISGRFENKTKVQNSKCFNFVFLNFCLRFKSVPGRPFLIYNEFLIFSGTQKRGRRQIQKGDQTRMKLLCRCKEVLIN